MQHSRQLNLWPQLHGFQENICLVLHAAGIPWAQGRHRNEVGLAEDDGGVEGGVVATIHAAGGLPDVILQKLEKGLKKMNRPEVKVVGSSLDIDTDSLVGGCGSLSTLVNCCRLEATYNTRSFCLVLVS